jgi:hypothetical protein
VSGAPCRLVFESFGVVAQAETDDPALQDAIGTVLPPGWRPATGEPQAQFALTRDGVISIDGQVVLREDGDAGRAVRRFGATVRHHLALKAPEHVFIHAGVVSAGDGAIVIPGSSRSGKSTLVAALVRGGASYYSDEYAVVSPDGLIQPYLKPLTLRLDRPDEPGLPVPTPEAQIATRPIECGLIVVTRYEPGAEWRPMRLSNGEGALALLRNAVAAQERPRDALAAVGRLSRQADVMSGARGEAEPVAQQLLGRTATPT